jgi:hypothetical protein
MIERILISLITHIASYLLAKALEKSQKSSETLETENAIDLKLKTMKDAYIEAFDGNKVTDEQKKNLRDSIINFVKSDNAGL